MINCRSGMFCINCGAQISKPDHLAFNSEGEVIVLCTECYDEVKIFFVKGLNVNESNNRRTNKGN